MDVAHAAEENAIIVKNVSKTFRLPHERHSSIKSLFVNVYKRKRGYEKQKVLNNISFEVKKGEFFGIVGRNGSGKSTLLKLLAGIYNPDKGHIMVNGKLTPFIELGVGFNPELTGRENVYLNGALLGLNRKEMNAMYYDIVSFAELEKFMDQKLKNYSSGMQVRLAFSIAIRARSDILLIDEVLAVGDAIFQRKCFSYFKELKRKKQTVILVSHDAAILQEYCDRGILIERGRIITEGNITKVVREYADILNEYESARNEADAPKQNAQENKKRWGRGDVLITAAKIINIEQRKPQSLFADKHSTIGVRVTYEAQKDTEKPVYGITVVDSAGQNVFQSNTMWSKIATDDVRPGERTIITWSIPNIFNTGDFMVVPAVADTFGATMYDWREDFIKLKIRKALNTHAAINVMHEITVEKSVKKVK